MTRKPAPPPRSGPRPLPLHLSLAITAWTSSRAVLPLLKKGSTVWRPEFKKAGAELAEQLASAKPEEFAAALEREAEKRCKSLLAGIAAYRDHPYRRDMPPPRLLWQEGTTKLCDYGHPSDPAVLFVPSLINRAYILDLSQRRSLLRYLASKGLRPILVDWEAPGPEETRFTLTDYIAGRLSDALDQTIAANQGRPVPVVGYCMGGLLALGLAALRPDAVSAFVALATPWDFHAERGEQAKAMLALQSMLGLYIDTTGGLPVDVLQSLFATLDPFLAEKKFRHFAKLKPESQAAHDFVALEDWLNDGIPLAGPVARECLFGWYAENNTIAGRWRIAGRPIRAEKLAMPSLVVVPDKDRIVPPASALPLAAAIPEAKLIRGPAGHIGMVAGGNARSVLYWPLARWLRKVTGCVL
jgi:polyhydroxyalkanoate synthase